MPPAACEMSKKDKVKWKEALCSILDDLSEDDYKKVAFFLNKIPKSFRSEKHRVNMVQKIIELYGEEKSISEIKRVMEKIPRRDSTVQDKLKPFLRLLEKLKKKRALLKSKSKASRPALRTLEPNAAAGQRERKTCAPEQTSAKPPGKRKKKTDVTPGLPESPQKTISDLKSSGNIQVNEAVAGKVVQKSGKLTYKTKVGKEKDYFNLALADETGCITVMVYGMEKYPLIHINRSYLFRNVKVEENMLKVYSGSSVSETDAVVVPEVVEAAAKALLRPKAPVRSIREVKTLQEESTVSVKGVVTQIDYVKRKNNTKRKVIHLRDGSDVIDICMWNEKIKQCIGLKEGKTIRVTDLKVKCYQNNISLSSTGFTGIHRE